MYVHASTATIYTYSDDIHIEAYFTILRKPCTSSLSTDRSCPMMARKEGDYLIGSRI